VLVSAPVENSAHALVVLLVEDEFFVRYSVADCLRDAGYVVVETESGEEAIALCKSDMSTDIVFTDINLAGAIGPLKLTLRAARSATFESIRRYLPLPSLCNRVQREPGYKTVKSRQRVQIGGDFTGQERPEKIGAARGSIRAVPERRECRNCD
jgi:CheY-like chemotaxis protein